MDLQKVMCPKSRFMSQMQPLLKSSTLTVASRLELETLGNALIGSSERLSPNWRRRKLIKRPLIALNQTLLRLLQTVITSTRTLRDQSIIRLIQRIWRTFWMKLQQTITITPISTSSLTKAVLMASHTSMMVMVLSLRYSLSRRGMVSIVTSRMIRTSKVCSPILVDLVKP